MLDAASADPVARPTSAAQIASPAGEPPRNRLRVSRIVLVALAFTCFAGILHVDC